MPKEKVIFVFYQTESQANGGVNSLWQLVKSFDKVEPILLTNARTSVVEEAKAMGISVLLTPHKESFSIMARLHNLFFWSVSLIRLLSMHGARAIHFNDILVLSYGVVVVRLLNIFSFVKKIKIIFNIRGVFEAATEYPKKWNIVNYCDDIIVLSQDMKKQLYDRLPLKNKTYWKAHLHFIYSIVDLDVFNKSKGTGKPVVDTSDGHLHWVYVAAFNEIKNQLTLIKNFNKYLKTEKIKIHFVGDLNEYADQCINLTDSYGLTNKLIFHGYKSEIQDYYNSSNLTILPTKREGLARCMIESISCGNPVVSFNVCSAKEILKDNQCGMVVNQGDYEDFFNKSIELSTNQILYNQYSTNGRNLAVKLFEKQKIINAYQKIYLS